MRDDCAEYQLGRRLLARLPSGRDIIASVADLVRQKSVKMGVFVINGAVSSYTTGVYDQRQQVYVTAHESKAAEIVVCHGHVSLYENEAFVHGYIALARENGRMTGGRLFSDTILFAGEIDLQELSGDLPSRPYDRATGRLLWNF